jgi:phosphoglycolate phosphatase-like HAD superfamily hydrolase
VHLILFDVDGTLIRGTGMGRRALERAFAEVFDLRVEEHPEIRNVPFAGQTDPTILAGMARALGIDPEPFQSHRAAFEDAYYRHLRVTVAQSPDKHLCPGVKELIPRLAREPRLLLGLLTGNLERGARIKLDPFGLNSYFAFGGFGSDHEDRGALAARALELARGRCGQPIAADHVLVVGDTEYDVLAGRRNDFLTAGVVTGFGSRDAMVAAGASAIFESLAPEHGFETWLRERWDLDGVVLEPEAR